METAEKGSESFTIAEEVDGYLKQLEQSPDGESETESLDYTFNIESSVAYSRTAEQQTSIELVLTDLESKVEQLYDISNEVASVGLEGIEEPRLKEVAKLLEEIDLMDERAAIAKVDDQATYEGLRTSYDELTSRLGVVRKKIEKLETLSRPFPSKKDLPEGAGVFQKLRYAVSRGYRESLYADSRSSYNQELSEQRDEESSIMAQVDEVRTQLHDGTYRTKELAVYQEFRKSVDGIKEFSSTELTKLAEEIKEEKDPTKKARLQAELLIITKEILETDKKMISTDSVFDSTVRKGYGYLDSRIDMPDTQTLFGDKFERYSLHTLRLDELSENELTPHAERAVAEFAVGFFGKHHQDFKELHDSGSSDFVSNPTYTSSSEVWNAAELSGLLVGPLSRPSEMLDNLLTDEELTRLSAIRENISKATSQSSEYSPTRILDKIIEQQSQAKSFIERLRSGGVVTHATTEKNALTILSDGRLRSEVGAKASTNLEVTNSAQGSIIENRTISFSIDGVEDQFLETYNPEGGHPTQERDGVIFASRTSEVCQNAPWFLMDNTQSTSSNNNPELQVIDGGGLDIKEMDIFVSGVDYNYWVGQLHSLGYEDEWIKSHVHPIDFSQDKYIQISGELSQGAMRQAVDSLPHYVGTYKDVRRKIRQSVFGGSKPEVYESAPEIIMPTKIFRL